MTLGTLAEYIYTLGVFPQQIEPKVVGELPGLTDVGCGLVLLDGAFSLEYFATDSRSENASMFQPILRFLIRVEDYPQGAEWCDLIKDALHRYHDEHILQCLFSGSILYLGRNTEQLHEFQLTFTTIIKE